MGGDIKGLQLAEFLVKRGRSVTVVEEAEMPGQGMNLASFGVLSMWLNKKGVTLMTGVRYEEINDHGLIIKTKDGLKQTIETESILPMETAGGRPQSCRGTGGHGSGGPCLRKLQ